MRDKWVDEKAKNYTQNYGLLWRQATSQWRENSGQDAFWLIAHTSYLFLTNGVRWGMDLSFMPPNNFDI
ncbi:MAG: hypothetical protein ACOX8S_06630 [Christensenellales bacterium]|jgi:hypothetical protein